MVDIKATGPGSANATERKKATKRPAGGPNFASLINTENDTAATTHIGATGMVQGYVPYDDDDTNDQPPRHAKVQAHALLESLQNLAEDIMAGTDTAAITKLENALKAEVLDRASLSPEAQHVLDELSTRAAVAAAKSKA